MPTAPNGRGGHVQCEALHVRARVQRQAARACTQEGGLGGGAWGVGPPPEGGAWGDFGDQIRLRKRGQTPPEGGGWASLDFKETTFVP